MAAVRLFLSIDTKTALLLEDSAICKAQLSPEKFDQRKMDSNFLEGINDENCPCSFFSFWPKTLINSVLNLKKWAKNQ